MLFAKEIFMNTVVANVMGVTGVKCRELNDEEKAACGPHSMVVGVAECCPYCRAKELPVISDTEDPDSPNVYIENHHDPKTGVLCRASESFIRDLDEWMSGGKHNRIATHVAKMSYVEFVKIRFPDTVS